MSSQNGAALDTTSDDILFLATMTGDVDAARDAIVAGANVDHANSHGMTPLLVVSGGVGPPSMMELLILAGADVNRADLSGWSALIYVCSSGQMPLVDLLLAAGANVHHCAAADRGWTPLTRAAYRGHAAIVTRLLRAGADPHLSITEGRTALEWATAHAHTETVDALSTWAKCNGRDAGDVYSAGQQSSVCTEQRLR